MNKSFKTLFTLFLGILFFIPTFTANSANIADDLTKLNNLYKENAITKEEFLKAKEILFKSEPVEIKKSKTKKKEKKEVKETIKPKDKKKTTKINIFDDGLSKTYITLEEANELGSFKRIEKIPEGMFEDYEESWTERTKKSMMEMYDVFVRKKNLMEKYPENLMKGMGYFEIFYMDQLDEKKKLIKDFKRKYPKVSSHQRNGMKSLYSLNQARKSMREAMGLTLEDDPEKALKYYMTMHDFLGQAEKKIHKLTKTEKKLKKRSANFKKHYGSFKKTVELRKENRIDQKTFDKDFKKNVKEVRKSLRHFSKIDSNSSKPYETIGDMFEKSLEILDNCTTDCGYKDLLAVVDSTVLTDAVLADVEKDLIKKKYTQDMSKVDMEAISKERQEIMGKVSMNMKNQKSIKKKNIQNSVLNLENHNFPVDEYLDKIEEQGIEIKSVTMSFGNVDEMKRWVVKDWANSWRGELPTEIKDSAGNLIEFTEANIDDLKAQLAINTFNSMIDTSALEINESMSENVKEIAQAIEASGGFNVEAWLSQDFTITLDNYSQLLGNSYGIEIDDFKQLTAITNIAGGTNMSPEEYASYWETAAVEGSTSNWGDITRGAELIDQVGSFEAASIAASIGTDLQTVADSIALAASVGVSTDLEAAAAGLGYDSFADAVAAYNEQYGTNLSVEEAKESLGQ
jgi:uncharacterized protein YqgQ